MDKFVFQLCSFLEFKMNSADPEIRAYPLWRIIIIIIIFVKLIPNLAVVEESQQDVFIVVNEICEVWKTYSSKENLLQDTRNVH